MKIDDDLSKDTVTKVEEGGWQMDPPVVHLRSWAASMSILNGAALTAVLEGFNTKLEVSITKCKSVCPLWEACFPESKDGERTFSDHLAVQMLKGKFGKVQAAHSALYAASRSLADGAARLSLRPRLQDHPVTSTTVAIAKQALNDARTCSVVIMGVEHLQCIRDEPAGATKARAFLEVHRSEKHSAVPQCFWAEFESLSAHGSAMLGSRPQIPTPGEPPAGHGALVEHPRSATTDSGGKAEDAALASAPKPALATDAIAVKKAEGGGLKRRRR